jgi:hypothetical protein
MIYSRVCIVHTIEFTPLGPRRTELIVLVPMSLWTSFWAVKYSVTIHVHVHCNTFSNAPIYQNTKSAMTMKWTEVPCLCLTMKRCLNFIMNTCMCIVEFPSSLICHDLKVPSVIRRICVHVLIYQVIIILFVVWYQGCEYSLAVDMTCKCSGMTEC